MYRCSCLIQIDIDLYPWSRLGVGAPIPESSASARDAVRLKHQLTGKGKKRSSADETSLTPRHQSEEEEEEEEERRGGTAKKKTKLDPFAGRSKMKAKLDVTAVIQSTHDPSSPHMHEDDKDSKTRGEEQGHDGQSISSSLGASIIDEGSYAKKKRQRYCDTGKEGSFQEDVIPRSHPQAITTPNRSSSDWSISANPPPPSGSEPSSMSFSISGPLSLALQPGESPFLSSQYLDVKQQHSRKTAWRVECPGYLDSAFTTRCRGTAFNCSAVEP